MQISVHFLKSLLTLLFSNILSVCLHLTLTDLCQIYSSERLNQYCFDCNMIRNQTTPRTTTKHFHFYGKNENVHGNLYMWCCFFFAIFHCFCGVFFILAQYEEICVHVNGEFMCFVRTFLFKMTLLSPWSITQLHAVMLIWNGDALLSLWKWKWFYWFYIKISELEHS